MRICWALAAAFVLTPLTGCGAPEFVAEGPLLRPLNQFKRMEARPLSNQLQSMAGLPERDAWAATFSKDYRKRLYLGLHRRKTLDALEGPILVLEGSVTKYEWSTTPGTSDTSERTTGTLVVEFAFWDESGTRLGGGRVTAVEYGLTPREAMQKAEKHVVASVVKFIRKAIGYKTEPETPEPEVIP